MAWLALSLALARTPAPPEPSTWRLVDRPELHLGARPAALVSRDEVALGVTLQLSVRFP